MDANSTIINAGPTVLADTTITNLNVTVLNINGSQAITELIAGDGISITGTGASLTIENTGASPLTPITSVTFSFTGAPGSCTDTFGTPATATVFGSTPRFFVNILTGNQACLTNSLFALMTFGTACTATTNTAWACFIQPAFGAGFSTGQQGLVTRVIGGSTTAELRTTSAAGPGEFYSMFLDCGCY